MSEILNEEYLKNEDMKIGISILGDLSRQEGTVIRAKYIFNILKEYYDTLLIIRGNTKNIDRHIIIEPEKSKLWNFKIIPVILKNKFDLIYCSADYYGFITYFLFSKIFKYKIILEAHGIKSIEFKEGHDKTTVNLIKFKISQFIEKFAVNRSDHVIALSQDIYDYYSTFNDNISLIPVFVDDEIFKPAKKVKKDEKVFVGIIGPFESYHINIDLLNFVYDNLDKFDERINFVIIGKCEYKINDERLSYTGYLEDGNEYSSCIASLDAVLIPSKVPSFGPLNKILESMASSVPVFVTYEGIKGIDHLSNKKNILVFKEENLINGVNKYIFNGNINQIGKEARNTIEKFYSKRSMEKKLLNILDNF